MENDNFYLYFKNDNKIDWRILLKYGDKMELNERRKLLWAWPNENNLKEINNSFNDFNISHILSVGCGTGLFEWFLRESTGKAVFGLETDKAWWQSSYAVKSFIELNYIEDLADAEESDISKFLQHCCKVKTWNFALLFCYFNNRIAFLHYLQIYKGNWLILIGPKPDIEHIHVNPSPLDPQFPTESNWLLRKHLTFGENDIIAIYAKL